MQEFTNTQSLPSPRTAVRGLCRAPSMNVLDSRESYGVYYTPPAVVRLIVPPLLRRLLAGRTPRRAAGLTVLDPACGGGAFLVGAYRFLLRWYRERYREADHRHLVRDSRGAWQLRPAERE